MNDGPYRRASPIEPDEPPPDPTRPWLLQTWTSRRECPNCTVPLYAARKEGYRIDACGTCGTCGGAWLDSQTSRRAIEERSLVPAILAEQAAKHARRTPPSGRHCPVCAVRLKALEMPTVDEAIARETELGRRRPPEDYTPQDYGLVPELFTVASYLLGERTR